MTLSGEAGRRCETCLMLKEIALNSILISENATKVVPSLVSLVGLKYSYAME